MNNFFTTPNRLVFLRQGPDTSPPQRLEQSPRRKEMLTNQEREVFNKLNYSEEVTIDDRNPNRIQLFLLDALTAGVDGKPDQFAGNTKNLIYTAFKSKLFPRFANGPSSNSINAEIRRFQSWASQITPSPKIRLIVKNGVISMKLDIPSGQRYTVDDYGKQITIPIGDFGQTYEIFNSHTEETNTRLVEKLRSKIRTRTVALKDIYPNGLDQQVQGHDGVLKLINGGIPIELLGVVDRLRDPNAPKQGFGFSYLREKIGPDTQVRVQIQDHEIRLTYNKDGQPETLVFEDARAKARDAAKARRMEFAKKLKLKLKLKKRITKPKTAPKQAAAAKKAPERKDPNVDKIKARFMAVEKKYQKKYPDFKLRLAVGKGLNKLNPDAYGIYAVSDITTASGKRIRYGSPYDLRLAQEIGPDTIDNFFQNAVEMVYGEVKSQKLHKSVRPELTQVVDQLKAQYPNKTQGVRYIAYTSSTVEGGKDAPHGFSIVLKRPGQKKQKLKISLGDYSKDRIASWMKQKLEIA